MNILGSPLRKEAYKLFHQATITLSDIEQTGIKIDTQYLTETIEEQSERLADLSSDFLETTVLGQSWKKHFKRKTNILSGDQLRELLYDHFEIESTVKTEKNNNKVDEKALLKINIDGIKQLLAIRKLEKGVNTYLRGIEREVTHGVLHPMYSLNIARSYRSCLAKGTLIEVVRDLSKFPKGIPIEKVKAGDYVYCYDDDKNLVTQKVKWSGKTGTKKVIRIHWADRATKNKTGYLDLTPEHRVRLIDGSYKEAQNLLDDEYCRVMAMGRCRHWLYLSSNYEITEIEQINQIVDVYDLEIEKYHNFIANEICVHNSSQFPNFQNQPIRDPSLGKMIRQCFIPRGDCHFGEADYSGLEVHIACCYHKDPLMVEYLTDPTKDMHRDMAGECFKLPIDQITKTARYVSKNGFVFPQFYGSYYKNCGIEIWEMMKSFNLKTVDGIQIQKHLRRQGIKNLKDFQNHLQKVEDVFWNDRFVVYNQWKKDHFKRYLQKGSFVSKTGFMYQGVLRKNQVINFPVQGSAFHCLLWSMIYVNKKFKAKKMKTRLIGQIHDSLILNLYANEIEDALRIVHRISCIDIRKHWDWINIPLNVEFEIAPFEQNWYQKQELEYDAATKVFNWDKWENKNKG